MSISLLEPVLRLRTSAGVSQASFSEILCRCADGSLVDLPGMRVDQRAPVVTTLAIFIHLERRYRTTLASALGDPGMALVGSLDAPAFMLLAGRMKPEIVRSACPDEPRNRELVGDQASPRPCRRWLQ